MDTNLIFYAGLYLTVSIISIFFLYLTARIIRDVLMDSFIEDTKKIKKNIEEIMLGHNDEVESSSHLVKCQLAHNREELKRVESSVSPILNELITISNTIMALKNTIDEREKLEGTIVKLKKQNDKLTDENFNLKK